MTALLRAEARKSLSTRSTLFVAGFVVLYPALSLLPVVLAAEKPEVDGASRDVSVDVLSGDVLVTAAATILVVTLYAIVGASVGGMVKNQTAAVAGALIWVFVVEHAIPLVLHNPGLRRWLPGGLSDRLLHVADPVAGTGSAWLALVGFAGISVVLAAAAMVATRRADIQ